MDSRQGSSRIASRKGARPASSREARLPRSLAAEAATIVLFAGAVFVLVALLTYHSADPSWLTNARGAARNACGRIGAQVAAILLQGFGMGAFVVPLALGLIAAAVNRREGSARTLGTFGGMGVAVIALSVFLSLQWKYWPYAGNLLLTGGAFGAWSGDFLTGHFNATGASIVALGAFCLAVGLSTPVSVSRFGAAVLRWLLARLIQLAKVLAGAFAYLVGLAVMRLAEAIGQGLRSAFERARVETSRPAEATPELPPLTPEIGTQGLHLPWEAPNALPELEAKGGQAPPEDTRAPDILPPESPAASGAVAAGKPLDAAMRAASKLARAARGVKRGQWKLPTIEFLRSAPKVESSIDRERLLENSRILQQKFADFYIEGDVTAVRPGPVITLYEFKPGPGVKVSRIASLADDLSMALSAQSVRILAPLPGKSVVGIEIPSEKRETVFLREFLQHADFHGPRHSIPVVMGKDIGGQPVLSDLARMPHLMCAGQTGAGKSVFMNGLICSLFYRFTPDELRMILVDPKFIEFRAYQDIPHLLLPVVDDARQASTALKWAVREMDRRYRLLALMGARNLAGFNQKVEEMGPDVVRDLLVSEGASPEGPSLAGSDWIEAFEPDETGAPRIGKLPNIVVIIDELADLMMIARKEVEISIARIAQKARAAGIHLVIATQRPSTDVVTGLIKANLPSRVSFQLASYVDSKTILDRAGAERLLGQGDMLFIPPGSSQLLRLHGALVDDDEIGKITSFLRAQGKPIYRDEILVDEDEDEDSADGEAGDDALFQEAMELVKRSGHASASFLQRHLKVGYNRAARMIETMEERGLVGPADGARPREVLLR